MWTRARRGLASSTNSRRNSGAARSSTSVLRPIQPACQSSAASSPASHDATALHGEATPASSHTRTFQNTPRPEPAGSP